MIGIIDYGSGNIQAIATIYKNLNIDYQVISDPEELKKADKLILPGVGAFGEAMSHLRQLDLIDSIKEFVKTGKPFMGICLGMQLLFSKSEECGIHEGIGIIPGKVVRFINLVIASAAAATGAQKPTDT